MALSALSSLNSLDLLNSVNYTRCWMLDSSRSHVEETRSRRQVSTEYRVPSTGYRANM